MLSSRASAAAALRAARSSQAASRAAPRTLRGCRLLVAAASSEDLYAVLNVAPTADGKELKSAYRKLALKLHPDVNPSADAAAAFARCKNAYTVLSDPQQRAQYDRARRGGFSGFGGASAGAGAGAAGGRAGAGWQPPPAEEWYGLGDFFRDLDKELSASDRKRGGGKGQRSLLEELADIGLSVGEELIDFLEGTAGTQSAARPQPPPAQRAQEAGARARAAGEAARESAKAVVRESVDEALAKMKRDMGL